MSLSTRVLESSRCSSPSVSCRGNKRTVMLNDDRAVKAARRPSNGVQALSNDEIVSETSDRVAASRGGEGDKAASKERERLEEREFRLRLEAQQRQAQQQQRARQLATVSQLVLSRPCRDVLQDMKNFILQVQIEQSDIQEQQLLLLQEQKERQEQQFEDRSKERRPSISSSESSASHSSSRSWSSSDTRRRSSTEEVTNRVCTFVATCANRLSVLLGAAERASGRLYDAEQVYPLLRDGVEMFVMNKLHPVLFSSLRDRGRQAQFESRLIRARCVLTAEYLHVPSCCRGGEVVGRAGQELLRMGLVHTPTEKADCMVRAAMVISGALSNANASRLDVNREGMSRTTDSGGGCSDAIEAGADSLLPSFVWVVLHSHLPMLWSHVQFVAQYRSPEVLKSRQGYCVVTLLSALSFLETVDLDVPDLVSPPESTTATTKPGPADMSSKSSVNVKKADAEMSLEQKSMPVADLSYTESA